MGFWDSFTYVRLYANNYILNLCQPCFMADCEICGETGELVITEIGGGEVEAGSAGSGFGKVKQKTRIEERFRQRSMRRERRNAPRPAEAIPLIV